MTDTEIWLKQEVEKACNKLAMTIRCGGIIHIEHIEPFSNDSEKAIFKLIQEYKRKVEEDE